MNAFCVSGKLKKILIEIAQARLPQHMGTNFSKLSLDAWAILKGVLAMAMTLKASRVL